MRGALNAREGSIERQSMKKRSDKVKLTGARLRASQEKKAEPAQEVPKPVKVDARICFAINYFSSEADAQAFAADVESRGATYNGGWFHGKPCGREEQWDYVDDKLGKLYAVTD
jgi:hypothetical protein